MPQPGHQGHQYQCPCLHQQPAKFTGGAKKKTLRGKTMDPQTKKPSTTGTECLRLKPHASLPYHSTRGGSNQYQSSYNLLTPAPIYWWNPHMVLSIFNKEYIPPIQIHWKCNQHISTMLAYIPAQLEQNRISTRYLPCVTMTPDEASRRNCL